MEKVHFVLLFLFSISGFAQEISTNTMECITQTSACKFGMEFKGGNAKMQTYIQAYLNYPKAAERANVSGKVYVKFRVSKRGKIDSVSVIKGIGFGCDEEAVRLVKSMPKWNPCINSNKKRIFVFFTLPIAFVLPD